jgi:hypothetical protein
VGSLGSADGELGSLRAALEHQRRIDDAYHTGIITV